MAGNARLRVGNRNENDIISLNKMLAGGLKYGSENKQGDFITYSR
jgi:hypothetical protein